MKPTREETIKGVRDGLVALHEAIAELSRTTAQLVTVDVAALDEAALRRLLSALKSVDECLTLELLGSATAQALTVSLLPPSQFELNARSQSRRCESPGCEVDDLPGRMHRLAGGEWLCTAHAQDAGVVDSLPNGITNLGGTS